MAWVWFGVWAVGFVVVMRVLALSIQDDIDRQNFENKKKGKGKPVRWKSEDVLLLFLVSMFWYVVAVGLIVWFLLFPRGFKSRFARDQEKLHKAEEAEAKARAEEAEAEARAAEFEESLRKMQDEVLRYVPSEDAARAMERLKRVVEGQRPSGEDSPSIIWAP